tara:strand:+ start:3037 stop:4086 length:1050 start_codon:yes stop_codon:yes gene_type:complete
MKTFEQMNNSFSNVAPTTLRRGELTVDPTYQMREKMNHEVIAQYVDVIDSLPPVNVIEVGHRKILVDGFHRYFTFERAERDEIPVLIIAGTEEDAITYAMAANFSHLSAGTKPNLDDQRRAIIKVLPRAIEKVGYSSASLVPLLKSLGLTASATTLTVHTREAREEIDAKTTRTILELRTELSITAIGETLDINRKRIQRLLDVHLEMSQTTDAVSDNSEEILKDTPIESCPFDADEFLGFDEEELGEVNIVNPADAKSKSLESLESGIEKDKVSYMSPVESMIETKPSSKSHESTQTDLIMRLQEFAISWKHSDKGDISDFLDSESEQAEDAITAILEAAELINNTRI